MRNGQKIVLQLTALGLLIQGTFISAEMKVPEAAEVWSVSLDNSGHSSKAEFAAMRSAVISGDRVVVVFEVGAPVAKDGRLSFTYRLLSLDIQTGEIRNRRDIEDFSQPFLYSTDDDHIILGSYALRRLNPDLTETGEQFKETGHGRTNYISPDGSTMVHEIHPGSELISSHTLTQTGVKLTEGVPTSVSRTAVLSNNHYYFSEFPHEKMFVTLDGPAGEKLVYHAKCGGRPSFLRDDKAIFTGCGKFVVVDTSGNLLTEASMGTNEGRFAAVSRNGPRFAIASVDRMHSDPWDVRSETFTIFDLNTFSAVAVAHPRAGTGAISWAAFDGGGDFFVCGGPQKLTLYRIPK